MHKQCTRKILLTTNSPNGRPNMLSSHITNSSVWTAWCIPEGNSGCAWVSVAHPSWSCQAAGMHQTEKLGWGGGGGREAHHTLNQKQCADTHTLTSSVSIWHPSACSPPRPSPTATAAGSVLRCFGDAARRWYNSVRRVKRRGEEAEEEAIRHWSSTNMNSGSMSPDSEETCCCLFFFFANSWIRLRLRAVASQRLKVATLHRKLDSNLCAVRVRFWLQNELFNSQQRTEVNVSWWFNPVYCAGPLRLN